MEHKTLITALVAFSFAGPAHAGLLGETVHLFRVGLNIGTVVIDEGIAVVGAGNEFSGVGLGNDETFNLSDTHVSYVRLNPAFYTAGAFNGWRIVDELNLIDDIVGINNVTFSGIGAGFSAANVTFDANNIYINFQGLFTAANAQLDFDVQFAAAGAVPVPGSLALLGLGLAGLGWSRRRKLAKVSVVDQAHRGFAASLLSPHP